MVQVIDNVMILKIEPEDKAKSIMELLVLRYEKQITENVNLRLELERIKEAQRKMSFNFPG